MPLPAAACAATCQTDTLVAGLRALDLYQETRCVVSPGNCRCKPAFPRRDAPGMCRKSSAPRATPCKVELTPGAQHSCCAAVAAREEKGPNPISNADLILLRTGCDKALSNLSEEEPHAIKIPDKGAPAFRRHRTKHCRRSRPTSAIQSSSRRNLPKRRARLKIQCSRSRTS
jgi:hypothetical protein